MSKTVDRLQEDKVHWPVCRDSGLGVKRRRISCWLKLTSSPRQWGPSEWIPSHGRKTRRALRRRRRQAWTEIFFFPARTTELGINCSNAANRSTQQRLCFSRRGLFSTVFPRDMAKAQAVNSLLWILPSSRWIPGVLTHSFSKSGLAKNAASVCVSRAWTVSNIEANSRRPPPSKWEPAGGPSTSESSSKNV